MKRFVFPGLAIAVLFAAMFAGAASSARAQNAGLLSSVLNRLERNHRNLRSLRAGITMEKYNAQIGESDRDYGIVLYLPGAARNASVRVEWQRPQREILAVVNGHYTLFNVRRGIAYEGNAHSAKAGGGVFDLISLSAQQLKMKFDIQDASTENLDGVETTHVKLVPRRAENYQYAEVWIDSDGMPVQTKVVEKNDDSTTIRLSELEKNPKPGLTASDFQVQLPGNVKKIRG
jgi:outer membrane lipoprotein-sorting protein